MFYLVLKTLPLNFARISVFLINVSFWARLIWCIRRLNNSCNFCINVPFDSQINNIIYLIYNLSSFLLTVAVATKQLILNILFSIPVTFVLKAVLLTDLFVLGVFKNIIFCFRNLFASASYLPTDSIDFVTNFWETLF